jgi:hypothetical protein
LLKYVTILTGYLNRVVSNIRGPIEALPILSAYLKPKTLGISIPKTIVKNETQRTAMTDERSLEYWLKKIILESVKKGFIISIAIINASIDAAIRDILVDI